MENIQLIIDGKEIVVPADSTILEAARMAGINIPTLCWLREINEIGACRMCVVEVSGEPELVTSCVTKAANGMVVQTHSHRVMESRVNTLKLLVSNHERSCLSCIRSGKCELQALCKEYGVEDESFYDGQRELFDLDQSAPHMIRDNNKCILCRRCVSVCEHVQDIGAIGNNGRGFDSYIGSAFDLGLGETSCVKCGQCIAVCPTGALYEKDSTAEVFAAIANPKKHVIVQTAPSVRAAFGECFGLPVGTDTEGKMVAALRKLGFDEVFDTNFGADLTIVEEANEFIQRVLNDGPLPLITSCSPGWVDYCEHYYPEMLHNLSSCKSPQQMFGAVIKTYYAEKKKIDPKNIIVVSIMPCTAKKYEIGREDQSAAGVPDVDYALTTRELGRMVERKGINFFDLDNEGFDEPLGLSTGAAALFGATGGVMEAALRTAAEKMTGEELKNLEFSDVRGLDGIKEAAYKIGGQHVKVAIASGLGNARKLMEAIKAGEAAYDFVEVMACPGGCVNGGGQPQVPASVRNFTDVSAQRASVLYKLDEQKELRKSHDNPVIQEIYKTYLEKPGSEKAHRILHTSYHKRTSVV